MKRKTINWLNKWLRGEVNLPDEDEEIQKDREIYNALCCLNAEIRDKQPKRAKQIQKYIKEYARLI